MAFHKLGTVGLKILDLTKIKFNGVDATRSFISSGTEVIIVSGGGRMIGGLKVTEDGLSSADGFNVVTGDVDAPLMIYTSSAGKVINTGAGLKVISNRFKVFGNGATITAGISVSDAGLNVMTGDFAISGSSSLGDKLTADGKLTAHAACKAAHSCSASRNSSVMCSTCSTF